MENLKDNLELQEMREQLALLNRKLEKEHILNEKMMRKAMHQRISKYRRERWWLLVVILLQIPILVLLHYVWGFSLPFVLVTGVYFFVALLFNHFVWRKVDMAEILSGNLCEASRQLVYLHQMNQRWMHFGVGFILLWLIWFVFEVYQIGDVHVMAVLNGGIVGGIVGGIFGVFYYRKKQKVLRDMIQEIENLTHE